MDANSHTEIKRGLLKLQAAFKEAQADLAWVKPEPGQEAELMNELDVFIAEGQARIEELARMWVETGQ